MGRLGWRTLLRHPWQSGLMILGIALGVAVAVAVDLANASAARAFDTSTDAVAGRATHQVVGGPQGLDEQVYAGLRRAGAVDPPAAAAPVVTDFVSSPQLGGRPLQLLGVDPLVEAPFRSYLWNAGEAPVDDLSALLTRPGAILLTADTAGQVGLAAGDTITLDVGGYAHPAWIAGLLEPSDGLSRRALVHDPLLVLADEPTGNLDEDTGRHVLGVLDRLTRQAGKNLILVTHSAEAAAQADRVLTLHDGRLVEEKRRV
jgi:putative ABC transport system permease protein